MQGGKKKWLKKRKRQDDRVDGARGGTGTTQPRATASVGASLRAGPCFGCGEWGHLKRNCPRSVRGAMPPIMPVLLSNVSFALVDRLLFIKIA